MRRPLIVVIIGLVIGGTGIVCAQEMNYNTFQVGSRSALLGGAVVGGVRDTSATFYNPGALGFVENSSISVSASAFRYGKVTLHDALGPGEDATTTLLDIIPLLGSGMLRLQAMPQWAFGYAVVTRQQYSGNFNNAVDMNRDTLTFLGTSGPIPNRFIGQANITSKASEYWAMGVASWRINETLALGIAPIFALRQQSLLQRFFIETIPMGVAAPVSPINLNTTTDISFYQLAFLARFGVAWEPSSILKLGATVTTPNLKMFSSGKSSANIGLSSPTQNINILGSDLQDNLSANYRTPLSVAVGVEIKPWLPLTLGLTVAYSTALGRQALLNVQSGRPFFTGPGTEGVGDSAPFLTPFDERRAVVNVSFGAEYSLNDMYAAYLGFWTDFSPLDSKQTRAVILSQQGDILPIGDINIYNVVVGATRTTQRSKIAAGVVVSHGTGTTQSEVDFTRSGTATGLSPLAIENGLFEHQASFFSISLLLGYTYFF